MTASISPNPSTDGNSLAWRTRAALLTADPRDKAQAALTLARDWRAGRIADIGRVDAPDRPGRPDRPELLPPTRVPRRKIGPGPSGRAALLHALAHIELNAIDLALDMLIRFPAEDMPRAFLDDWLQVAGEEGTHFLLLADRLAELGSHYGAMPAHDGLWQAAIDTADDLLARLAIVPLVLEARGLDVTPAMIEKLSAVGDEASAAALKIIYRDEVGHVAIGMRWFRFLAERRGVAVEASWTAIVRARFPGRVKPPFNDEARGRAGFAPALYTSVVPDEGKDVA